MQLFENMYHAGAHQLVGGRLRHRSSGAQPFAVHFNGPAKVTLNAAPCYLFSRPCLYECLDAPPSSHPPLSTIPPTRVLSPPPLFTKVTFESEWRLPWDAQGGRTPVACLLSAACTSFDQAAQATAERGFGEQVAILDATFQRLDAGPLNLTCEPCAAFRGC